MTRRERIVLALIAAGAVIWSAAWGWAIWSALG
jgi:hypothetical protein